MIVKIPVEQQTFDSYVQTEELIVRSLSNNPNLISDDFELLPFPFTVFLNNYGLNWVNEFLKRIHSDKKRIIVCQHIWAEHLLVGSQDILCTPHSTENSNSIPIGHQAVNVDFQFYRDNREIEFSFMGSLGTHLCRKILKDSFPPHVFDPGVGWGLDKNVPETIRTKYIQLLGNSNFSVCPRGTGISSVRLFESLGMGSIPVIIADGYKPPLANLIPWNEIAIFVSQNQISSIPERIQDFKLRNPNLHEIRKTMKEIFEQFFSNSNLHVPLVLSLQSGLD